MQSWAGGGEEGRGDLLRREIKGGFNWNKIINFGSLHCCGIFYFLPQKKKEEKRNYVLEYLPKHSQKGTFFGGVQTSEPQCLMLMTLL